MHILESRTKDKHPNAKQLGVLQMHSINICKLLASLSASDLQEHKH